MKQKQMYDVVVLGSGAAGMEGARQLAEGGKKVALVEKTALGGTAYYDGALPVKGLLDAFKANPGVEGKQGLLSWQKRLDDLQKINQKNLNHPNIAVFISQGAFISSHCYEIDEVILQAKAFIIATGTSPKSPFNQAIDEEYILSHRFLLHLPPEPGKITILGGNVEGFELAFALCNLGYEVTLVEKEKDLLFGNDEDLVRPLEEALARLGCNIIKGAEATALVKEEGQVAVTLDHGQIIRSPRVLLALARQTNLPKGLDRAGVTTQGGFIPVNDHFVTSQRHIYAIGDVNGIHGMAHVAWDQGRIAAHHILHKPAVNQGCTLIPRAVFTSPELAGAGLQETDCKNLGIKYKLGKAKLSSSYRGWSLQREEEYAKVLLNGQDELLGLWLVGDQVSEKIGFLNYFMVHQTKGQDLISTLTINPSLEEGIKLALQRALDKEEQE